MIALRYNFGHPFQGKVIWRKTGCKQACYQAMSFDSAGQQDFDIPLQIDGDGVYHIVLNWEYEGRAFSHESNITVKNGRRIPEHAY